MLSFNSRSVPDSARGLILLLVIGAGLLLFGAEWQARTAERDARAPIVIAEPVDYCSLSPGGRFLITRRLDGLDFYDIDQ
jgi:hypothetical protein